MEEIVEKKVQIFFPFLQGAFKEKEFLTNCKNIYTGKGSATFKVEGLQELYKLCISLSSLPTNRFQPVEISRTQATLQNHIGGVPRPFMRTRGPQPNYPT
jgi:hypothetical protein